MEMFSVNGVKKEEPEFECIEEYISLPSSDVCITTKGTVLDGIMNAFF